MTLFGNKITADIISQYIRCKSLPGLDGIIRLGPNPLQRMPYQKGKFGQTCTQGEGHEQCRQKSQ